MVPQRGPPVQHAIPDPISTASDGGQDDANDADFSFQRPKKQKKVCIVEEDIKMTKDEIAIYNQMRDEADEVDRQAALLFQEQQSVKPDLGPSSAA